MSESEIVRQLQRERNGINDKYLAQKLRAEKAERARDNYHCSLLTEKERMAKIQDERISEKELVSSAICYINSDIYVTPGLERSEAVRLAYVRLNDAVSRFNSSQPPYAASATTPKDEGGGL